MFSLAVAWYSIMLHPVVASWGDGKIYVINT